MSEKSYDYDVLVIGSGPGGYVAAIRAAQLGLRVALVEKGSIGGVCLNIGCIPTKSIIHQAEIYRGRAKLAAMGVGIDDAGFRYENVFNTSRKTAEMLSKGVAFLLKKNKVEVISGTAKVVSEHEIAINGNGGSDGGNGDERRVSAKAVIVATGSRPKAVSGIEFDGKRVLSSDDALMLKELPKRVLIVGGGVIGVEFAHIMNAFGVEAHIVEMAERILPFEDGEITAVLARSFTKRGIKIHTSSKVSSYKVSNDAVDVAIEGAGGSRAEISVDKVFVMTGRAPNTEGIGLEEVGVNKTSDGFVETGDYYQTSVPSIYAIGDIVASSPLLAHAASAEGEIAVEHIAGRRPELARVDAMSIPSVVYCEPQTAYFGLTEEAATARGVQFVKAVFPYRGCGKAVADDAVDGMVKIMADPSTQKIVGAHITGAGASELIHELLLARNAGINVGMIASMIHAHPALSETIMEAAKMIEGRAIHI
jgi:dihydrolipoamide dehydrogenase